ncbi:MAG: hypothetical protein FWF05_02585 [Oscillospiraceae bacterium]|nr:hypothetical protein [Oscillospiraceae bacterium]
MADLTGATTLGHTYDLRAAQLAFDINGEVQGNVFDVVVKDAGGNIIDSDTGVTTFDLPSTTALPNDGKDYDFDGWSGDDGSTYAPGATATITQNTVFTPIFTQLFTISFAGTNGTVSPTSVQKRYGDVWNEDWLPTDFTPSNGYTEVGGSWSATPETVTENTTITYTFAKDAGQWATLTFETGGNGTINGGSADVVVEVLKTADWSTVTVPTPVGTGNYFFVNWTPAIPSGTIGAGGTYTANFTNQVPYSVEVYVMGTNGLYPATPTINNGSAEIGKPLTINELAEVIYGEDPGYFLDKTYGGYKVSTSSLVSGEVFKIYVARAQVTYNWWADEDDQDLFATVTYRFEANVTNPVGTPAAPEGFEFDKWVTAPGGSTEFVPGTAAAIGPVNIYAKFVEEPEGELDFTAFDAAIANMINRYNLFFFKDEAILQVAAVLGYETDDVEAFLGNYLSMPPIPWAYADLGELNTQSKINAKTLAITNLTTELREYSRKDGTALVNSANSDYLAETKGTITYTITPNKAKVDPGDVVMFQLFLGNLNFYLNGIACPILFDPNRWDLVTNDGYDDYFFTYEEALADENSDGDPFFIEEFIKLVGGTAVTNNYDPSISAILHGNYKKTAGNDLVRYPREYQGNDPGSIAYRNTHKFIWVMVMDRVRAGSTPQRYTSNQVFLQFKLRAKSGAAYDGSTTLVGPEESWGPRNYEEYTVASVFSSDAFYGFYEMRNAVPGTIYSAAPGVYNWGLPEYGQSLITIFNPLSPFEHTRTVVNTPVQFGEATQHEHDFGGWISDGDGKHFKVCANDDCNLVDNKTESEDCTFGPVQNTPSTTCGEPGTNKYTCTECGYFYTEDDGVTKQHAYSGAFTSDGDETHSRLCTNGCGTKETVAHDLSSAYTAPVNCGDFGFTTTTCSGCNYSKVVTDGTSKQHVWSPGVVSKGDGTHAKQCTLCDAWDSATLDDCDGFGDYVSNDDGTHNVYCTECGYLIEEDEDCDLDDSWWSNGPNSYHWRDCFFCGYVETGAHVWVFAYAGQQGGKDGKWYECSVCYEEKWVEDDVCDHEWGDWTYNGSGSTHTHSRECSICNEVEGPVACSFNKVNAPSTACGVDGIDTYTCSVCAFYYTEDDGLPREHDLSDGWISDDDDTHTVSCKYSNCDYFDTESHSKVNDGSYVPPVNCGDFGYQPLKCEDCDWTGSLVDTTAKAHDWTGPWVSEDDDTHNKLCKNGCETLFGSQAHTKVAGDYVPATTCGEKGYTEWTCEDCDWTFKALDPAAKPHDWTGAWVDDENGDDNGAGTHSKACLNDCGATQTESHDWVLNDETYRAPTTSEDGYAEYDCECGAWYERVIPMVTGNVLWAGYNTLEADDEISWIGSELVAEDGFVYVIAKAVVDGHPLSKIQIREEGSQTLHFTYDAAHGSVVNKVAVMYMGHECWLWVIEKELENGPYTAIAKYDFGDPIDLIPNELGYDFIVDVETEDPDVAKYDFNVYSAEVAPLEADDYTSAYSTAGQTITIVTGVDVLKVSLLDTSTSGTLTYALTNAAVVVTSKTITIGGEEVDVLEWVISRRFAIGVYPFEIFVQYRDEDIPSFVTVGSEVGLEFAVAKIDQTVTADQIVEDFAVSKSAYDLGEATVYTVTTLNTAARIQLVFADGSTLTYTKDDVAVNQANKLIWTVNRPHGVGSYLVTLKVYTTAWTTFTGNTVSFTVSAPTVTPPSVEDGIISFEIDNASVTFGTTSVVTFVTSMNVDKIRLVSTVDGGTMTFAKTAFVSVVEDEGTLVWTLNRKFTKGAWDFYVEAKVAGVTANDGWVRADTNLVLTVA